MKKQKEKSLLFKIKKVLLNYFVTQFILMVIVGIIVWGILSLLNVQYALVLGVITGIFSAVPNFGMGVASLAAALVAILDKTVFLPNMPSFLEGVVVLVIFIFLNKIIDLFLAPLFLGKTNDIHPIILFLVVLIGTLSFGVIGAILALPLLLIGKTIFEHYLKR